MVLLKIKIFINYLITTINYSFDGLHFKNFSRMIIREFSEHDIDEITSLMKKLCKMRGIEFDEERWRMSLEDHMKKENSEVIVAFDKVTDQVIGMAQCSIRNSDNGIRFGYISNLIVKEEKRRTGIGENLMRYIIDYFKKNHIPSIRLSLKTNLDEAASILFTKLGFNEIFRIYELNI
jgi:ribosomal protein S18 acetylase RimI-like enzyme